MGHARTGRYLHWAKVRPSAQCRWCQWPSQTRDPLFMVCPEWKVQQKILRAEVQKETRRWRAGGRSGIYFPMGDVGRRCWAFSPQRMWEGWCRLWKRVTPGVRLQSRSSGSAGSGKRNERWRRRSGVLREDGVPGRNCRCSCPRPPSWHLRTRLSGGPLFLCHFLCDFLCARLICLGQAWAEGEGDLATCRHCADCE